VADTINSLPHLYDQVQQDETEQRWEDHLNILGPLALRRSHISLWYFLLASLFPSSPGLSRGPTSGRRRICLKQPHQASRRG
jgi:hypothetical protein